MSIYTDTADDQYRECPYCGHTYQPNEYDISEQEREQECVKCKWKYFAYNLVSVTYHAKPDCELNGEKHEFEGSKFSNGNTYQYCKICDKCQ